MRTKKIKTTLTLEERFWAKVDVAGPDECWEWLGGLNSDGYGNFWDGKTRSAHRVAYEISSGTIPPGLMMLHSCDNPKCCNPKHLRPGTDLDNTHDMMAKGRKAVFGGEKSPTAKLSAEQVARIKEDKRIHIEIASEYGVARTTISKIKSGTRWSGLGVAR